MQQPDLCRIRTVFCIAESGQKLDAAGGDPFLECPVVFNQDHGGAALQNQVFDLHTGIEVDIVAVSYTHLDVYKRQDFH